jgi:hypothetical protein
VRHLTRFLRWRRYRRYLAALARDDRRAKRPLTPERIAGLKDQARRAARLTGPS